MTWMRPIDGLRFMANEARFLLVVLCLRLHSEDGN